MAQTPRAPFSSTVQLTLEINGASLPVAKSAPDRITLVTPTDLPAGPAVLKIMIDDRIHTRDITLPAGASADSRFVHVASANAPINA